MRLLETTCGGGLWGVYDFDLESYIGLARRLGTDTKRVEVKAALKGFRKVWRKR